MTHKIVYEFLIASFCARPQIAGDKANKKRQKLFARSHKARNNFLPSNVIRNVFVSLRLLVVRHVFYDFSQFSLSPPYFITSKLIFMYKRRISHSE
jgi:hypothetical protein